VLPLLCALLGVSLPASAADGLLFRASLESGGRAEFARGDAEPLIAEGVRWAGAAELSHGARLTYDARGNLYAEQGTVSFLWRPDEPVGRVSFPLFLVSYEQHSTWDFTFLRIGWTGSDLQARITDRNYVSRAARAAIKPQVGQWVHVACSWSEADGLALYVNGSPAGRAAGPLALDARLDQFGLLTRAVTPHHTAGNENAGSIRDVRIYRAALDPVAVARLAAGEDPGQVRRHPVDWSARFGWSEQAAAPAGETLTIRRVPILEARDLGKFWLKGADGKQETFWPMIGHGYADEGKQYRLEPAAEAVNWIRTSGNLAGRILVDGEFEYVRASSNLLRYYRLPAPRLVARITIEREQGVLNELECLRIQAQAPPDNGRWVHFAPQAAGSFHERRDPETYTVWTPDSSGGGVGGRGYHYFVIPLEKSPAVSAVRMRWQAEAGAYYYLAVTDPSHPARQLIEADLQATGRRADVTLDFPDLMASAGAALVITLASSAETIAGVQAQLLSSEEQTARREHVEQRLLHVRDSFQLLSEARPWMQISSRTPASLLRRQLKLLDELYVLMEDLLRVDPGHPVGRAYWGWVNRLEPPPPFEEAPPPDARIPLWAHRQLTLLRQFRQVVDWWIANRQIHTGEMGGGLGDDTDMIQNWPAVALLEGPPEPIRESARRVLEACYAQGMIADGLNRMRTDPLHAYEEGMNAFGPVFLLDYGNPVIFERMMETAAHYPRLTGINSAGHRHFRSYLYSATDLVEEGYYGREDIYSHLILHPGLYVAWYNGSPRVVELLKEFADSLLAHWGQEKYPDLARTIFFADDRVSGRSAPASETFNLFWGLYEITGESRYRWLAEEALRARDFGRLAHVNPWRPDPSDELAAALVADARRRNIRDRNLQTDQAGLVARVLAWQATGDLSLLEEAQAALVQHMAQNMYMYTEAEQFTDRIWIPTLSVQRERLGGVAHYRNYIYPGHAVSWESGGGKIAALVTGARSDYLSVVVYNTGQEPVAVRLRVWRLDNGRYEATLRDEEGSELSRFTLALKRYSPVHFEAPPRRTVILELRQMERGRPLHELPDLAVAAEEIGGDPLEVPVHNIGAVAAGAFIVRVFDETGRQLAEARQEGLEAPVDLKPRIARVRFPGLQARPGLVVAVNLTDESEEITEENNRAVTGATR